MGYKLKLPVDFFAHSAVALVGRNDSGKSWTLSRLAKKDYFIFLHPFVSPYAVDRVALEDQKVAWEAMQRVLPTAPSWEGGDAVKFFFTGSTKERVFTVLLGAMYAPKYTSHVLVDDIQFNLHPDAQVLFVTELMRICKKRRMGLIFSTNSPYVLDVLPSHRAIYTTEWHEDHARVKQLGAGQERVKEFEQVLSPGEMWQFFGDSK